MLKNDLIIWFDDKTGNELSEKDRDEMIEKMRDIANNYGYDFCMCGNPESIKRNLDFIFENKNGDDEE